ncbi:MAG: hypothetical protein J3R72DRAFT_528333 [Linnemannia gamsii]|nr:MAG: hypothetical protein J3R72DRAFT_528333 [Linnemannia gamsii]
MNQNTSDQSQSASAMRSSNQQQESTTPAHKQQLQEQRSETPSHTGQSNIEAPMSGSKLCGHVSDCDCSTETAIHASEEHAPRTKCFKILMTWTKERKNHGRDLSVEIMKQTSKANGVAPFGDHQICLAEESLIHEPKLDKEV